MPDTAWAIDRHPPDLSRDPAHGLGFDVVLYLSTLHQWFAHARLPQAKLQEQLAQTMETFNLGDDASTFNEMREKIDKRVAAAEAKLQLGTSSIDTQMQDIEREAHRWFFRGAKPRRPDRRVTLVASGIA